MQALAGTNRRTLLVVGSRCGGAALLAATLVGCGFQLRGTQRFAFETIALSTPGGAGPVAAELRRALGSRVRDAAATDAGSAASAGTAPPQVTLELLSEQRERTVVGLNASGQVRELQLRIRVRFRLRSAQGKELIADTEILQKRDVSFNESAVLAKEAEEALLYRDMQTDVVQQLLRRLSAITTL